MAFRVDPLLSSLLLSCVRISLSPTLFVVCWFFQNDIMETAPRRYVKPLAPPVVADRSELPGLSQIEDFEVRGERERSRETHAAVGCVGWLKMKTLLYTAGERVSGWLNTRGTASSETSFRALVPLMLLALVVVVVVVDVGLGLGSSRDFGTRAVLATFCCVALGHYFFFSTFLFCSSRCS